LGFSWDLLFTAPRVLFSTVKKNKGEKKRGRLNSIGFGGGGSSMISRKLAARTGQIGGETGRGNAADKIRQGGEEFNPC